MKVLLFLIFFLHCALYRKLIVCQSLYVHHSVQGYIVLATSFIKFARSEWTSIFLELCLKPLFFLYGEKQCCLPIQIIQNVIIYAICFLLNHLFFYFFYSGCETVTRGNILHISLSWPTWTHIPSIYPCRSSCISQLAHLLHLCLCCQVCQTLQVHQQAVEQLRNFVNPFWTN